MHVGIRMDVLLNMICTEAVEGGESGCVDHAIPDTSGCYDYDKTADLSRIQPERQPTALDNLPPIRYPSE